MMMTVSGLEAMIYNDFSAVSDIIICRRRTCWKTERVLARGLKNRYFPINHNVTAKAWHQKLQILLSYSLI